MRPIDWIMLAPLLLALLWAAIEDFKTRRIPNWLTFPLVASGVVFGAMGGAGHTLWSALLGLVCGFGIGLIPFVLGGRGGGDVKLLSGVGAWLGAWPVLLVFAAAAVFSMIIALAQATVQGRLMALLRGSAMLVGNTVLLRQNPGQEIDQAHRFTSVAGPLPYAVPVLLGVVLVVSFG